MRTSNTGLTQYVLEIQHDFSGTWGTGYFENIGNPNPGVGKHWYNLNEEVICNVDGIVNDVNSLNSRYIATGYYAQGPPNTKDKANALIFGGVDDFVSIESVYFNNPKTLEFRFWAKRDRTNQEEWMISHPSYETGGSGFYMGFNDANQAVLGSGMHGLVVSTVKTDTGWHEWRFVLEFYPFTYHTATGQGLKLFIYRDGVEIASQTIEPPHWSTPQEYEAIELQEGCHVLDMSTDNLLGQDDNYRGEGFPSYDYDESKNHWEECRNEWGLGAESDHASWIGSQHHIQICADYTYTDYTYGVYDMRCDRCYRKGIWLQQSVESCKAAWLGMGHHWITDAFGITRYMWNNYDGSHMVETKAVKVTKTRNLYYSDQLKYIVNGKMILGRGYSTSHFQGKLKDIEVYENGMLYAHWALNDGESSTIAADSSGNARNGLLNNFDTSQCWMIDPTLSQYYKNSKIQERQSVHKFKMTSPGKIVYDWGRQHAVVINTLPENMGNNISVQILNDSNQEDHSGSGKYWYNHGSKIDVKAEEGQCLKLLGYTDNNNDPLKTIKSNIKMIDSLNNPESISWKYSSYFFEEKVVLGSPVALSNVPPNLLEKVDLSKKPKYISSDHVEADICFWNDAEKRIYPLRADEIFDLEYDLTDTNCESAKLIIRVKSTWPDNPHIIHVAKTPPVKLDPQGDDDVVFMDIKHIEADANVTNNYFTASQKGRSVLHFMRNYIKDTLPKEISVSLGGYSSIETKPISLPKNFTIEFFAKRNSNDLFNVVIGQDAPEMGKSLIIGFENNNFIFHIYGNALTSENQYKDNEWHHWACVYETDTSEITDESSFICDNNPDNPYCHWNNNTCFNEEFIGDYDNDGDQRFWNDHAKVKRRCGTNVKYKRKIYCDGQLIGETEAGIPYTGQGSLVIGMVGKGWDRVGGFKGQIDEVRVWTVAKTQNDIESHMNSRLVGNEDHLRAYYRMDKIGAAYLEDNRINCTSDTIAIMKNLDPSNAWIVDTQKLYSLEQAEIPILGTTCIRVVETKLETENKSIANAVVGYEISGYGIHDYRVPNNGYVFYEDVPYNTQIYNRDNASGPIYPVNTKNPTPGGRDQILVIWYKLQDNVSWPYQPADYTISWPVDGNRIVIASRMGSDGKNAGGINQTYPDANNELKNYFDPARYQEITIYNQPNPLLPGYNPNEEHALVTGSFRHSSAAPRPFAAFALRNDLNITSQNSNYTSDPFVLVQYYDTVLQKHGMKPFKVEKQDVSCGYTFDYLMTAGDPVVPPYPLNEVIGATPPSEIFGKNGSSEYICYWKDHKGQSWSLSGGGQLLEIADASLTDTGTNFVNYKVTLATETFKYADTYLVKVTDNRGYVGTMPFIVGSANSLLSNSQVFVDGNSITNDYAYFTVKLQPGSQDLSATNFKLYKLETSDMINVYYWYPLQPSFWFDKSTPGDSTGLVGLSIPWLPDGKITSNDGFPEDMITRQKAVEVTYDVVWPEDVPVLKAGETLTFPGGEYREDNPDYPGLPGVLSWAAGQIVYDSLSPRLDRETLYYRYLARLVPALNERQVDLSLDQFPEDLKPASKRVNVIMNRWYFKELHAGLQKRIFYDPMTQKLGIKGFVNDKTLGDDTLTASPPSLYVLQPNILTDREVNIIKAIEGANPQFKAAVDSLFDLTNDPEQLGETNYTVGLEYYQNCVDNMVNNHPKKEKYLNDMFYAWLGTNIAGETNKVIPKISFGPGLALVPNGDLLDPNNLTYSNFTSGYITIAENNHPDMGALPVSLHIIKVVKEKVRGAVKTVFSDNVFDEKITLRHSADFGANPNDLIFQWWYREEDGSDQPTPEIIPDKWLIFPDPDGNDGVGMSEISLSGAGAVLLVDNLFYVRYRHKDSDPDNPASWSQWAGAANSRPEKYIPQLAEGWVKRVLNGINPFEARINNFYNSEAPATYVSMIKQAGPRYEGPVAFNPSKDVIENVGLIELYQTVLNRAKSLSIDLEQPTCTSGITNAILLATTRVSTFYNLLGNEAYNDALDPTIGFGTDSSEYGSLAPTIFTFMNQTPSLLDEEVTLLCGRSEKGARPAYNRFLWNFTKAEGEVAYALSYNMFDVDLDGFIDEADGRILYPQGHGDAWGHYLTALKNYYDLLSHPEFNWIPRAEKFSVEGVVIDVDYYDERKFAETAASKAQVGSEVLNLTYRKNYVEDPDGQWQGYKDSDKERAWGVTGWGRRAFIGSLFDWTMANAIIPTEDTDPTHTGLKKIDRTTVMEILDIASQARTIQNQYDNANNGLNPLGLTSDAVPFDINPARLNPELFNTATHFEQVYENAMEAMENARAVFDYANDIKNKLRELTISEQTFTDKVIDEDRDYRNKLIEMFGTPYEGTIGPGKAYPPGYKGPDYYFYSYIDVNQVSEETIPPPSEAMMVNFKPQNQLFIRQTGEDLGYKDVPAMFTQFFSTDLIGSEYASTDFSGVVDITFPMSAEGYSFQAPPDWGMRKSPGEIQVALIELIKAEADLQLALAKYSGLMGEIYYKTKILQGRSDLNKSELDIANKWRDTIEGLNDRILGLRLDADMMETMADKIYDEADASSEYLPKIVGALGGDPTAPTRGALQTAGNVASYILRGTAFINRATADYVESDKELAQFDMDIEIQKANYRYDIQQILAELEGLLGDEAPTRIAIFKQREHMRQVSEKYRALLSKGLRLLEERKVYNARVAQKTQGKRYMDMAFRMNLNQSLSKYRNAFDVAARYAYLAAKAYDYDTNLSDRDPASAKPLLTNIIRQRHLGQFHNGQYVLGQGGLGDILAKMSINYKVIKTQMGFNTPQTETGRFSLRSELMRIKHDESSDAVFRDELKKKCVDDLWSVPEFRKYCRPFASQNLGKQPGIVITFGTQIIHGNNFFGWPLSGGDHTYDPTNFATKVRSVGVWFEGYDNSKLSETPRIYLFPTGMDVMLVPDSTDLDTREWTVVDQKLPIPLPVIGSDLNNPDWIPSLDSLDGSMNKIRRFSSFRAYHDSGYFDANEMSFESRLVGRSVWNTQWMIIIPGGVFHYDQDFGLKTFIENVKDIKLFFQTYAISGN
jgi:hypothetical protein